MTFLETLVRAEHRFRPLLSSLPPTVATRLFSVGRTWVSTKITQQHPLQRSIPDDAAVTAWGMQFRTPLWNAAGMFKNGHGYEVAQLQGAGAFVAGTTTANPRAGNKRNGVLWPAVPYPHSRSASNWMGLPNEGHAAVARRLSTIKPVPGCPLGASVSAQPEVDEATALAGLIEGMLMYQQAGVQYLELNESCPNVEGHAGGPVLDQGLLRRLEVIREKFLRRRTSPLPVVVKFSVDTDPGQVPDLLATLIDMEFDGVILGNTSTRYAYHREHIAAKDRPLFDLFTTEYGGGLSGAIVKDDALKLAGHAASIVRQLKPRHEFQVIRCGGISSAADLEASRQAGILLNQWYTGYYEAFAVDGHDLYSAMLSRR